MGHGSGRKSRDEGEEVRLGEDGQVEGGGDTVRGEAEVEDQQD